MSRQVRRQHHLQSSHPNSQQLFLLVKTDTLTYYPWSLTPYQENPGFAYPEEPRFGGNRVAAYQTCKEMF